ncbi:MAG: transmembrane domain-containing protein [Trueperaceae bacterium]|nr:transmembrane domain-containing protein [Trueperaceae bacterium]
MTRLSPVRSVTLLFCVVALSACGGVGPRSPSGCTGTACCMASHHAVAASSGLGTHTLAQLVATGGAPAASAGAPLPSPTPTRAGSDSAGWPGGVLPAEGDDVVVHEGEVVLLDVSPPPLGGLTIEGALVFARQDLELAADHVMVHGSLHIGSQTEPFLQRAVVTLTGSRRPDDGCLGGSYLAVIGGSLELYGDPTGSSWTRLAATAAAGATSIAVDDAAGWQPGDRLAIASTDFYTDQSEGGTRKDGQVEERLVTAVDGNRLQLDSPLTYEHYGEAQEFAAAAGLPTTVLESRAEVVRLTRNVTVQGRAETADPADPDYKYGGHIMAMGASSVHLDSVELTRMGQAGVLLRYPVHWHLMGDAGAGSFVRNSSLHDLYNRCVTIHGTNGVLLDGNAAYNTFGHCYFLEDGAESGNVLRGNLALQVREPVGQDALLPSDTGYLGPAAFWVTNPANDLIGNVAASSDGSGFWYALPEHPTGPSFRVFDGANTWPRRTPLGVFEGNLAHSNMQDGLHVDRGPRASDLAPETTYYDPRVDPADRDSAPVQAVFSGYVAYKHRSTAAWFRGANAVLRGALLADNAIGVTFASRASGLEDSVVIGETANRGSPRGWEPKGADGRTLPRHWQPDFAIRGFEFYDGPVFVRNTYFGAFEPNAVRGAGAISALDYTSFSMSPASYAEGLRFDPATNRVRFETRDMSGYDPTRTDSGEDGYRSAVFKDVDGSVTGAAGRYVTVTNPVLAAPSCAYREDWNANVCDGRYAGLTFSDDGPVAQGFTPLTLTRAGEAAGHVIYGSPNGGPSVPNDHYRSVVRLGYEYRYEHTRGTPANFSVDLGDVAKGDRLVVSMPYGGTDTPYVYRDWWIDGRNLMPAYWSLATLRDGADSGYFLDPGAGRLYLLLVQQGDRDYARLTVCQKAGC